MTHQELESLLRLLRREGVGTFKGLGIEVTLTDRLPPHVTSAAGEAAASSPAQPEDVDSLLFWSVTE